MHQLVRLPMASWKLPGSCWAILAWPSMLSRLYPPQAAHMLRLPRTQLLLLLLGVLLAHLYSRPTVMPLH